MAYAIRTILSKGLRGRIRGIGESAWQPVVDRAGWPSEEESSCRLVHSKEALMPVIPTALFRCQVEQNQSYCIAMPFPVAATA